MGAVIERNAEERLTRIETADGVTKTLLSDPDLEPVDIAAIASEAVDHLRETTTATVETELPARAFVVANAGVRSVVDSLLENAVEHGGGGPRVRVTIEERPAAVEFVVEDDGPGVPGDELETLFEPRGESGGGGLYLVSTLVDGYGSDIAVGESSLGGARFGVAIPRDEEA